MAELGDAKRSAVGNTLSYATSTTTPHRRGNQPTRREGWGRVSYETLDYNGTGKQTNTFHTNKMNQAARFR